MLRRYVALVLVLLTTGGAATARDLPAASAGEHLWLIEQQPAPETGKDAGPEMRIYHLHTDAPGEQAVKLDPIKGELMPRGVAAHNSRLLIVTKDRQITTVRPAWSELMRRWEYESRTLPQLPEGCRLLSIVMSDRGPWALVHVQSDELLQKLDQVQTQQQPRGLTDQRVLNQALGLPEDLQWGDTPDSEPNKPDPADRDTPDDAPDSERPIAEQAPEQSTEQAPEHTPEQASEQAPALRLIHLRSGGWVSSPLPEGFDVPRDVVMLIRPDDKRPTLIVDNDTASGAMLIRYTPVAAALPPSQTDPKPEDDTEASDADAASSQTASVPAWAKVTTGLRTLPGRLWSATLVNGQVVAAVERYRPRTTITVDTYLLRSSNAISVGWISLHAAEGARWSLLPWQNTIGLTASPAISPDPAQDPATQAPAVATLAGLSLAGQPLYQDDAGNPLLIHITEFKPSALDGNADLLIQIVAFIFAMTAMILFYRRAPNHDQIDLPDKVVLASFARRAVAGIVDLTPGFLLASMIYDISFNEIVLYAWPGNGVEKAFAAMRPGLVVIGVTLFHTTIMEFIFARSVGKFVTGIYVAELSGKVAPPAPCLGRAISRVFELFAPLLILIAVISPARQRLGDILAKTIVVMPAAEEEDPNESDDD